MPLVSGSDFGQVALTSGRLGIWFEGSLEFLSLVHARAHLAI